MRVRELEIFIAGLTPWTASEIDQRTRRLREAKMLSVGGRGPYAPAATARDAARILISLAASFNATEAVNSVRTYGPMAPAAGGATLEQELESMLADPSKAQDVLEVVVCKDWPDATVRWKGGASRRFQRAKACSDDRPFAAFSVTTLSGDLLLQLAEDLQMDSDDE